MNRSGHLGGCSACSCYNGVIALRLDEKLRFMRTEPMI
jgi:hypothetical protein